jgi:FkbM family methyltransferase
MSRESLYGSSVRASAIALTKRASLPTGSLAKHGISGMLGYNSADRSDRGSPPAVPNWRKARRKVMAALKDFVKNLAKNAGYRVSVHRDPFENIRSLIGPNNIAALDIGANKGQTITMLQRVFKNPTIHAFEPTPKCFAILKDTVRGSVHLNQYAVGAEVGQLEFNEAGHDVMSSLLEPAARGWNGRGWKDVKQRYMVNVTTVDTYCEEHSIKHVDLLKTDTQGYDLNVLKGAVKTLGVVSFVHIEMNLIEMYQGQATFDELYRFLSDHDFILHGIYETHAHWVDGLFINKSQKNSA